MFIFLITEDKHLLDSYSEDLHRYIEKAIIDKKNISLDDLIQRWKPDNFSLLLALQHHEHDNLTAQPPSKKQRVETHKPSEKLETTKSTRKASSTKPTAARNQLGKYLLESTSSLAAKEIIPATQFNEVFPSVVKPPLQNQPCQQEKKILSTPTNVYYNKSRLHLYTIDKFSKSCTNQSRVSTANVIRHIYPD